MKFVVYRFFDFISFISLVFYQCKVSIVTFFLQKKHRLIIAGGIFFGSISWVIFVLCVCFILPLVLFHFNSEDAIDKLKQIEERSKAILIQDKKGQYLGIVPRVHESDFIVNNKPLDILGVEIRKDHKTVLLDSAPEHYWKCLKYLEDRHLKTWRNYFGVDFVSTLMIPISGRGGSTLAMQIYRSMIASYPRPKGEDESYLAYYSDKIAKKGREWISGPILQQYLFSLGGEHEFARWAANHIALIQGGGDYDVFGVELAGRTLFGKSANELDIAEQFILAASVKSPITFNVKNKDGSHRERTLKRTWKNPIDKRASQCVSHILKDENTKNVVAKKLSLLRGVLPTPFVNDEIKIELEKNDIAVRKVARHPESLSRATLPGINELVGELRNRYGAYYRNHEKVVNLTIDAAHNIQFQTVIQNSLIKLDKKYKKNLNGFCFSRGISRSYCKKDDEIVPISIAVSDDKGNILSIYSNDQYSNYFGSIGARKKEIIGRGKTEIHREKREIASIGKIAAALLLAETGKQQIDKKWDNQCILDQQGCSKKKLYPREIFARSINDGLVTRVSGFVDDKKIHQFMEQHNFTLPKSYRYDPAATNLVLGKYAGSLQSIHLLLNTALDYVNNGEVQKLYYPTMISDESLSKDKINNKILNQGGRTFSRLVLESPLCHPKGTLRRLSKYCARNHQKIKTHIAKTGTKGNGSKTTNNEYDYYVGGALTTRKGKSYTYVVRLGTGSPRKLLLKNVGAGNILSPVVKETIEHILRVSDYAT